MSAPGSTWVAAGGLTAVGLVADAAGADPTVIGVVVATLGLVMSVFRLAGALQVGLAHRHVLDQESAVLLGDALGKALARGLAIKTQDVQHLEDVAQDAIRANEMIAEAVRSLPPHLQGEIAEGHHRVVRAMDVGREARGRWRDSAPPRG